MQLKLKKIKPMFNRVVTTANCTDEMNEVGIITKVNKAVDEFQTVVAVGDTVRTIKVGDVVCINPDRYAVRKYKKDSVKADMEEYNNEIVDYQIPGIILDGVKHLVLIDSDVSFIVEESEEIKPQQILHKPTTIL